MSLQNPFVFFDFEEPLIFFFLDYLAVMGLFVWAGHYLAKLVRKMQKGEYKIRLDKRKESVYTLIVKTIEKQGKEESAFENELRQQNFQMRFTVRQEK